MFRKLQTKYLVFRQRSLLRSIFITAAVGILLVSLISLENLSYDLAICLKPSIAITNAVMVYENQETLDLGTDQGKLSRTNYARLLDVLNRNGAGLVFMDVIFDQPAPRPDDDQILAQAIRQQGSVILVAGSEDSDNPGFRRETTLFPPIRTLAEAAKGWGHAEAFAFGNIVRQISGDYAFTSYAGWVAATNLNPQLQRDNPNEERWLNYYGGPDSGAIPSCSLQDAVSNNIPAGFFTKKIVFVGQNFSQGGLGTFKDTFNTPYSRFGSASSPGVVIHATALLNLIRGDWLARMPRYWQWLGALIWGFVSVTFLYSLSRKSKIVLVLAAGLAGVALCAISLYAQWHLHWWWAWIGPACAQTPLAMMLVMRNPKPDRCVAFISYRTEEDGAAALLIEKGLLERGLKTFIDHRSLKAGKFDEQLLHEIVSASFFVLILSPNSLARCVNEGDWVLKELTHALAHRKKIIPVMKNGFSFDTKQGIPDLPQIAELRNYHGLVYSNSDFDGFMEKLKTLLKTS